MPGGIGKDADIPDDKNTTPSPCQAGPGNPGVLKGARLVLKGGKSVLKDRWRQQNKASFSYDPFGPNSSWDIDFQEEDMGSISSELHVSQTDDYEEKLSQKLANEAKLWETGVMPPMCVKAASKILQERCASEGHVRVEQSPKGLNSHEQKFISSHTCAFTLHCKKHAGSESDAMPMFIRPLCAADREAVQKGLGWLSLRSQIMRFLSPMPRLSEHELSYLTELDYSRHFAWCLVSDSLGVGIGRYVCKLDDPTKAELALTVIDPIQGLGLSSLLTWATSHVAYKNGVKTFTGVFHTQNVPIHRMVEKLKATGLKVIDNSTTKELNGFEIHLPMPVPDVASLLLSDDELLEFMHAVDGHAKSPID
eukprot:scaffold219478_cov40-Prasinocladus_malaysianus.AAC.1